MRATELSRADRSRTARARYFREGTLIAGEVANPVWRSWNRCSKAGHDPARPIGFDVISRGRAKEIDERNHALLAAAKAEIGQLAAAVRGTKLVVLLSDEFGTVIDTAGDVAQASGRLKLAARKGVDLSENAVGTNAIGTALIERAAVATVAYEHFFDANAELTCVAAPLFGPDGALVGILDVSGDHDGARPDCLDLVRTAAQAIENTLVRRLTGVAFLAFSPRPDLLATPLEAILAFDPDGRVVGGNRRARTLLSIDPARSNLQFEHLFESTSFAQAVHDTALDRPQMLRSVAGLQVAARFDASVATVRAAPRPANAARPMPRAAERTKHESALAYFDVVATDERTRQAMERAQRALRRDLPVLLMGETGSGKELMANVLHATGDRSAGPFVPVNCGALPEQLVEAELFGYADGAFTGARRGGAIGKLELANGGTLFLDEIGDMPMSSQTKLLRVLQERSVTRLGESRERPIDIALVCATHCNLAELIVKKLFREDLYYRINGLSVTIPPLRERTNILDLARHLVRRQSGEGAAFALSSASRALLLRHPWPGNLRQLGHVIASAAAVADAGAVLEPEHFPEDFVAQAASCRAAASACESPAAPAPHQASLDEAEIDIIERAVRAHGGNVSAAARALKISRSTIYNKWRRP